MRPEAGLLKRAAQAGWKSKAGQAAGYRVYLGRMLDSSRGRWQGAFRISLSVRSTTNSDYSSSNENNVRRTTSNR